MIRLPCGISSTRFSLRNTTRLGPERSGAGSTDGNRLPPSGKDSAGRSPRDFALRDRVFLRLRLVLVVRATYDPRRDAHSTRFARSGQASAAARLRRNRESRTRRHRSRSIRPRVRLPDRGRRQRRAPAGCETRRSSRPPTSASTKLLWKVKLDSTPRAMHNLFAPLIAERVDDGAGRARARASSPASPTICSASTSPPAGRSGTGISTARWPIRAARTTRSVPAARRRCRRWRRRLAGQVHRSTRCRGTAGLRQVNLADGQDVAPPEKFMPGGGKPYALNLHNGVIYTATAQGCGGLTNAFYSFDLASQTRQRVHPRRRRPVGPPRRGHRSRGPRVPRHRRRAVRSADPTASATASSA